MTKMNMADPFGDVSRLAKRAGGERLTVPLAWRSDAARDWPDDRRGPYAGRCDPFVIAREDIRDRGNRVTTQDARRPARRRCRRARGSRCLARHPLDQDHLQAV